MKRIDEGTTAPGQAELPLVLYVEDEPANWEVTELRLRKRFRLLWARSDVEAIAAVRQHGPALHAILMDVQLRGSSLDGIALARLLRGAAAGPVPDSAVGLAPISCPLFFVTAYGNQHTVEELEGAGDATVAKPVDFVKLSLLLARDSMKRMMETLKK